MATQTQTQTPNTPAAPETTTPAPSAPVAGAIVAKPIPPTARPGASGPAMNDDSPTRLPGVARSLRHNTPANSAIDDILNAPRMPQPVRDANGRFVAKDAPAEPASAPSAPASADVVQGGEGGAVAPPSSPAAAGENAPKKTTVSPSAPPIQRFEDIGRAPVPADSDDFDTPAEPAGLDRLLDGVTFTDDAAKHRVKSIIGRTKGYERRIAGMESELDEALRVIDMWDQAARRNGWVDAGPNAAPAGAPAAPSSKTTAPSPVEFSKRLDTRVLRDLAEEKGVDAALLAMGQAMDQYLKEILPTVESRAEERARALVTQELEPVRQTTEQRRVFDASFNIFRQAAERADAEGNPIYPELGEDREVIDRVVDIWNKFDPKLKMDPSGRGVHFAVLQYRHENGIGVGSSRKTPSRGQAPTSGNRNQDDQQPTTSIGRALLGQPSEEALVGDGGTPRTAGGTSKPGSEAASVVDEILAVRVNNTAPDGTDLGFRRRRF